MKFLINADDFGFTHSMNEAIVCCFKKGYIQRTSIMTNMPFFEEAIELSKNNGFFDKVGMHLNISEGEPITEEMKSNTHFCRDGYFHDEIFKSTRNRFFLTEEDRHCLELEIEAQMRKYIDAGFKLMHIDSHRFSHNNLSVIIPLVKLAKKHGFNSMRIMEIRKNDKLLRKLYKQMIIAYVSNYFSVSGQFLQHLENYTPSRGLAEFMTHPNIVNGKLVDVVAWEPDVYINFTDYLDLLD